MDFPKKKTSEAWIIVHSTVRRSWDVFQWHESNISRTCLCSRRSHLPSAIQLLLSAPNQCYQKCCQFCRWTNFSRSPPQNRYASSPCPCLLPLKDRTERRGADTVPQPDLYSGQAVYYIKKALGLCKSTCPTFLPKLPEAFHYERASDKAGCLGEVKKSVHKRCRLRWTSTQPFKGCFHCRCPSIYSTDNAVHFLVLHPFDIIVCNTRWNI